MKILSLGLKNLYIYLQYRYIPYIFFNSAECESVEWSVSEIGTGNCWTGFSWNSYYRYVFNERMGHGGNSLFLKKKTNDIGR